MMHVPALAEPPYPPPDAVVYGYGVVRVYPHDPKAFTQGLIYRNGFLFESTGINGQSTLRMVRLETGEVIRQHKLDPQHFAEGLTECNNRLIQLTWKSNFGFIYELTNFKTEKTFHYSGEGWGLTHDGKRLIMSDGGPRLRFLDQKTFKETGRIPVTHRHTPVSNLNELEFVKDEIFANIWKTDQIVRIDPRTGWITGWIDLRNLLPKEDRTKSVDVLNGIAYDAGKDRLFVTGKYWPKLFEIRLR